MSNPMMKGGAKRGAKNPKKTLKRVLVYAFSNNKLATALVVFFVLLASVANVTAASRVSVIVTELLAYSDDVSLINLWNVVYPNIIFMGCVYLVGSISSMAYNLIMMYISNNTLRKMRNEMFSKMQNLPLKYFDTHTHGDLMSLYTNDVDTMRQLLSQTIPQLISSALTILAVFVFMALYSVTLLMVVLVFLVSVFFVTKFVGGRSAKHYVIHQKALGNLNGFVEEMTEGQKVVKVFCHEQKAREDFKKVNDELNEAGYRANSYAFLLGPITNNIGYLQYVIVALVGVLIMAVGKSETALLSVFTSVMNEAQPNRMAVMAGMLVSFLMFARQFNMPVMQVAQQFSSIVMALAGAERIFEMTDEQPEDKGGDVVLTRGESEEGKWAWKRAAADGGFEYIP
ncbi:MAG: ABC transporter ATP-binding protein, partial [Clostridia bacterium]|nr:ABC transporter ATP-binding protein [Clostridia bacterium]